MKKLCFLSALALTAVFFTGCNTAKTDGARCCRIHGTAGDRFEGKKIFLVPVTRPATMHTVDSVVIKDGKFEFTADTCDMRVIRIDYHYRSGVQDLLVVTEPGDVEVTIDSVSSCKGSPQNDSLQAWKECTERHYMSLAPYRKSKMNAEKMGDTAMVRRIGMQIDSMRRDYRRYSRRLADNLKEGTLHDFLKSRFPTSYKKKMPDGSIKTIEID